ncbi:MAG: glycoside hydrolase family 11 protein [Spirochaeta sp.]
MQKLIKRSMWLCILGIIALAVSCASAAGTAAEPAEETEAAESPANDPNVITSNRVSEHNGYTYELWNQDDIGSARMTLKEGSTFDIQWRGIFNMLGRIGLRPGVAETKVTYNVENYSVDDGLSYLALYGWTYNRETEDNLVEFYIVENWINYRPGENGTYKGSVVVDGDEYDIYTSLRMQQPSILGTQTFYQYWSVRKPGQERTSGTIDIAAHFDAWQELDMTFGDVLHEVSFCVEGYSGSRNGSGRASVTELSFH